MGIGDGVGAELRLGRVTGERFVAADGPSPYGQFFAEDTQYYGGGFQLQL